MERRVSYIVAVAYPRAFVTYDSLEDAKKAARELAEDAEIHASVSVLNVMEVCRFEEAPPAPPEQGKTS